MLAALACALVAAGIATGGESDGSEAPPPIDGLAWSAVPGAFEVDLLRRRDNPLYIPSRREIGKSELLAAKRVDSERAWEALEEFISIAASKKRADRKSVV